MIGELGALCPPAGQSRAVFLPMLDHAALEIQEGIYGLRLAQGAADVVCELHGLDLGPVRDVGLVARHVQLCEDQKRKQAGAEDTELLPAVVKHAQGLLYEHFGREVPQRRADEHRQRKHHKIRRLIVRGGGRPEHRDAEAAAERHARPEHRAQDRHCHDLARRLHVPPPDDQHAQRRQRQASDTQACEITDPLRRVLGGDALLRV